MRAIDADAMLEYLNLMYDKQNDSNEPFNCAVLGAINYIKHKAPTIDAVSVVQGKWILLEPRYPIEQKVYWSKEQALADTKGNGARERRKCSCCGYTKSFMCHMKDEQIKLWNFCPNCGARMKGADDENV